MTPEQASDLGQDLQSLYDTVVLAIGAFSLTYREIHQNHVQAALESGIQGQLHLLAALTSSIEIQKRDYDPMIFAVPEVIAALDAVDTAYGFFGDLLPHLKSLAGPPDPVIDGLVRAAYEDLEERGVPIEEAVRLVLTLNLNPNLSPPPGLPN